MSEKNKIIKCLMHYDVPSLSQQSRHYHLAAATKADYIFETFARLGYQVEILSASLSNKDPEPAKTIRLNENTTLRLLHSGGRGSAVKNKLSTAMFKARYFFSCLRFIKSGDTVWAIAKAYLPPDATDRDIARACLVWAQANPQLANPNLIYPGQPLTIPQENLT